MNEQYQVSLYSFAVQYQQVQALCAEQRPDRSEIGMRIHQLVTLTDTFPDCERARFLVELHKLVYLGAVLDYTWGPTTELLIITRILAIGDPPDRKIGALIHPVTLALMHERYAYISRLFAIDSPSVINAHKARAAELRNPMAYYVSQRVKQLATQALIDGAVRFIERRRA